MIKVFLTAFAFFAAFQEGRWVFIGSDDAFESVEVDRSSIRRSGNITRIWERRTFHSQDGMLREIDIDCRERRLTVISITWHGADGAMRRGSINDRVSEPIEPETLDEKVFGAVCD